jgi:NTP pyrophosphatase (non-canonical NTP hydrolase)
MDFKDFSRRNRTRCEATSGFAHPLNDWSLSDWMTAVVGEIGEAANIVKKLNRVRDGIPGNVETPLELKANLKDEIADAFIYLDLLAQSQGFYLEDVAILKFNKTSKKLGYSDDGE